MSDKCRNCPDVKYRQCPSPNIISNGQYCCEVKKEQNSAAVCSQCGNELVYTHFAYESNKNEFWCEDCLRELYEELRAAEQTGTDNLA